MQRQVEARATGEAEPLRLRIGVNLGDVIVEDDDIHGDGVNVAARLEAPAEPDGISISRSARDQIRDKLAYAIADQGEVEVKNIARPVRGFAVSAGPAETGAGAGAQSAPTPLAPAPPRAAGPGRRLIAAGAAAALLAVAAGALLRLEPWTPRLDTASV